MEVTSREIVRRCIEFRAIYFPRYRKTCDVLHERNMHFIHHCCGQAREYMGMFCEAGCDVIQLDQPNLMGIEWLAEHFGGKICFWNPVDIQTTIAQGDVGQSKTTRITRCGHSGGRAADSWSRRISSPTRSG